MKERDLVTSAQWQRSLRWILACISVCPGCASSPPVATTGQNQTKPPRSRPAAEAFRQPYMLFVASSRSCEGDHASDISDFVRADSAYAEPAADKVLKEPTPETLESEIAALARAGEFRHGLLVIYTGHGVRRVPQGASTAADMTARLGGRSHLCLSKQAASFEPPRTGAQAAPPGKPLEVGEVLEWLDAVYEEDESSLPWATVIINACESSFVDVSRTVLPLAVISASPSPVTIHRHVRKDGTTPFVKGLIDALTDLDRHDANADGILVGRELLSAIRAEVFEVYGATQEGRPDPRLQQNVSTQLPLRFHLNQVAREQRAKILGIQRKLKDPELVEALDRQLELGTEPRLPHFTRDLVTTDVAAWQRCVSPAVSCALGAVGLSQSPAAVGGAERGPCLAPRPDLLSIPELQDDEIATLAKYAIFAEVYEIRVEGERWADVRRLRDDRLMATVRGEQAVAAVPRRLSQVRGGKGWTMFRALGGLTGAQACPQMIAPDALKKREPMVCAEQEGQCFVTFD
jgi:hypothetical protein